MAEQDGARCEIYDPEAQSWTSYLKLWGTRGSVPVSGPQYTTFGGNTSCLEVARDGRTVIIDAGTGIRSLGDALMHSRNREVHLFFGHTHWDHIIGFPFFMPLYSAEFIIHIYAEETKERTIQEALTKILRPHYFPVRLEEMQAELRYHPLVIGSPVRVGDITVSVIACEHPGGALAFRIDTPDRRVAYVTDHEFLKSYRGAPADVTLEDALVEPYLPLIDFLRGSDPIIHEAQYTPREYRSKVGWGHSSMSNATALMKLCEARDWYVIHHDPAADDENLHRRERLHWRIIADAHLHCHVSLAFDGLTLPL
jgi:ribonuclease BN (tRNA processing enzyme)